MQNEPFMIRLLQKFLLDPTYVRLATAISSADMPTATEAAHTMKGMCGNLSMDQLFQLLEQQLAALRAGDLEEGSRIMPSITHAYDAAVRAIEQLHCRRPAFRERSAQPLWPGGIRAPHPAPVRRAAG